MRRGEAQAKFSIYINTLAGVGARHSTPWRRSIPTSFPRSFAIHGLFEVVCPWYGYASTSLFFRSRWKAGYGPMVGVTKPECGTLSQRQKYVN